MPLPKEPLAQAKKIESIALLDKSAALATESTVTVANVPVCPHLGSYWQEWGKPCRVGDRPLAHGWTVTKLWGVANGAPDLTRN